QDALPISSRGGRGLYEVERRSLECVCVCVYVCVSCHQGSNVVCPTSTSGICPQKYVIRPFNRHSSSLFLAFFFHTLCMCVYVYVCICVCIMCVCVCICVFICVCVCVCVLYVCG